METINPEKLLLKIVKILDNLKVDYFITGGFAVSVWGRPRSTADIDIVIKIIEPKIEALAIALRKISKAGYIDENTAREAVKRRGEFNFIDPDSGFKIDFWVAKDDEETRNELNRRISKKINNQKVYFISPEDLVLNKINWYKQTDSNIHLEDVDSVFRISTKRLDKDYLGKQAKKLGFLNILNKYL